jgi:alanyl-tRNA synthetase
MTTLTPQQLAEKTWDLYQTHGVPFEVSEDIIRSKNLELDSAFLNNLIEEHQNLSRTTSSGQFKSGLGGDSAKTRKLHTTTHILHQVLRSIFGENTRQMGSAITEDKARFDFSLEQNLTDLQLVEVQTKVQQIIDLKLKMNKQEMSPDDAKKLGAIGLFGEKYGDKVTVYTLSSDNQVYSREFCGGPHIENTTEIGKFEIIKQKSLGQGVKRLVFDVV